MDQRQSQLRGRRRVLLPMLLLTVVAIVTWLSPDGSLPQPAGRVPVRVTWVPSVPMADLMTNDRVRIVQPRTRQPIERLGTASPVARVATAADSIAYLSIEREFPRIDDVEASRLQALIQVQEGARADS
jgi:hypothetical protein